MCITNPASDVTWNHCVVKHISHRHVKVHIEGNCTVPISSIWVHTVVYYKYNTYQKYAIDLWEDFCGFLNKTANSYFVKFLFGNMMNYTNLNHPCPYFGQFYVKVDNFSVDKFLIEQLVPAGRYRLDVNFTKIPYNNEPSNVYGIFQAFGAISDHRIEQF